MSLACTDFGVNPFDANYDVIESHTLQCTSLTTGSNKFYQMELHRGDSGTWRVFTANGRTGVYSKPRERITKDEKEARKEYDRILNSKTGRKKDPYTPVQVVSSKMGTEAGNRRIQSDDFKKENVTCATPSSNVSAPSIPSSVKTLIRRLFDEAGETCRSQLHGSLRTSEENPLGTLTLTQIEQGNAILQEANVILSKDPSLVGTIEPEVIRVTNAFYSAIPHNIPWRPRDEKMREEWMKRIALNNSTVLDEKFDLLDLLADVKGMMGGFVTTDEHARLVETNCDFDEVDPATARRVFDYMTKSQSVYHQWSLIPRHVWRVSSKAQQSYRTVIDKIGGVRELWHGSRASNILGICKKGLVIRPPGVYVTGSMFGSRALYFADQSTKSSQYSTARFGGGGYKDGRTAFMFVADVALGRIREMHASDSSLSSAGRGYDSVMGVAGRTASSIGKLLHNEFVIYDVKQEELTYLVEFSQKKR